MRYLKSRLVVDAIVCVHPAGKVLLPARARRMNGTLAMTVHLSIIPKRSVRFHFGCAVDSSSLIVRLEAFCPVL